MPKTLSTAIFLNFQVTGQGLPILCLHGHPGTGNCMSIFTEHLSSRFQTIAPDLRGYGKSRTNRDFAMIDHLLDLEALLDHLQIDQCLVLGWSLGGILAIELALRLPQRIKGLILIATAAHPRGNHPPIKWQDLVYTGLASLINLIKPGWQWNIDTFGQRSLYRYLLHQHTTLAYQYLAHYGIPAYWQTSPQANKALNIALRADYNRLSDLEHIQCACLMLAGEFDRHITAISSQETARHLPHCQWQSYPNTAHLLPWEIPKQLLQDIEDWLDKNLGKNF